MTLFPLGKTSSISVQVFQGLRTLNISCTHKSCQGNLPNHILREKVRMNLHLRSPWNNLMKLDYQKGKLKRMEWYSRLHCPEKKSLLLVELRTFPLTWLTMIQKKEVCSRQKSPETWSCLPNPTFFHWFQNSIHFFDVNNNLQMAAKFQFSKRLLLIHCVVYFQIVTNVIKYHANCV